MLRRIALIMVVIFSANAAYAVDAVEVVNGGKIIASGANEEDLHMLIKYQGKMYNCHSSGRMLYCWIISKQRMQK